MRYVIRSLRFIIRCISPAPIAPKADLSPGWEKTSTFLDIGSAHCTIASDVPNERYVMAYIREDTKRVMWAAAPADDFHKWERIDGTVFEPGSGWYSRGGRGVCLVAYGDDWYFFFDDLGTGMIGLAIGKSLGSLNMRSEPVLVGDNVKGSMEQYVRHPAVVTPEQSHDGQWHMIYDGRRGSTGSAYGDLRHATSADGIVWKKDGENNPVLTPSNVHDFEADDVGSPTVVKVGSEYWLAYHGYNRRYGDSVPFYPHWIGVARSANLIDWTKEPTNPVLPLGEEGEFDSDASFGPAWHPHHDRKLFLYFTGLDGQNQRRLAYASFAFLTVE